MMENLVQEPEADMDAPAELVKLLQLSDRREPAVTEIAVWVALGIIQGRLRPGQDLNSVQFAQQFGTSRTPVREALQILESDGLVEMRARKRPRVASFSPEQIREIFFLRAHLMSALAQKAAEKATDSDIAELNAIVESLRRYGSVVNDDRYLWVHYNFFDAIVTISGNGTARGILNSLFLQTLPVRQALSRPARLAESLDYAELILEAFQRRDGQMASLMVSRSIQAALEAIERGGLPSTERSVLSRAGGDWSAGPSRSNRTGGLSNVAAVE
jgi:DNA-binding GntR family transcriptional regulator